MILPYFAKYIFIPEHLVDEKFLIGWVVHLSLGLRSGPLPLSSSSCLCSLSCSFFSRSSTSRSLEAVSTGLAPPKIEADRLEAVEGAPLWSSSFGTLRGFRFNLGLWGGPEQIKPNLYSLSPYTIRHNLPGPWRNIPDNTRALYAGLYKVQIVQQNCSYSGMTSAEQYNKIRIVHTSQNRKRMKQTDLTNFM